LISANGFSARHLDPYGVPANDLLPVHDRAKRRMPWYAKSDDYPIDTTATKNMVTNTASTSVNMMVTPTSTLDLRV
jgi:hypothetical protein